LEKTPLLGEKTFFVKREASPAPPLERVFFSPEAAQKPPAGG